MFKNGKSQYSKLQVPHLLFELKNDGKHVSGTPGVQKLGRESFRELSGPDNIRFSSRKSKSNNKVLFSNCKYQYVCWWAGMQPPGLDPLGDLLFVPSKTVQQHSFVKGGEGFPKRPAVHHTNQWFLKSNSENTGSRSFRVRTGFRTVSSFLIFIFSLKTSHFVYKHYCLLQLFHTWARAVGPTKKLVWRVFWTPGVPETSLPSFSNSNKRCGTYNFEYWDSSIFNI